MTDPEPKTEPDEFSNFDSLMRGLVGVDPEELDECPNGGGEQEWITGSPRSMEMRLKCGAVRTAAKDSEPSTE